MFKRLKHTNDQLHEVEQVNPEMMHIVPISVGLFFHIMLHREKWNFTTISSKSFMTLTTMKNLIWAQTPSTCICWKKNWKTFFAQSETIGMRCVREIAQTVSMSTQQTISFPECVETHTRNLIRGNHVSSRKDLDVQKGCVFAVKGFVAMIERVTSTSSAAKF